MYRLQVKTHFDAAHYIEDYPGKCSRMHGHTWAVEVAFEGEVLSGMNILEDFARVKSVLALLVDKLDHTVLNEVLGERNVTAELLAKWFWDQLPWPMQSGEPRVRLARVCVWESPDCCVKYYGS
jgi:6-pyruvoyltetrahydropterin/6-carboxytetrahydropterin synthase